MTRRHPHSLGMLLGLLALVMQLGFGVSLPRSDADAVLAAATLCHTDDGGVPTSPHTPDCALCPLCATVASTVVMLPTDGPAIPTRDTVVSSRPASPPQASTPLSIRRFAAQPRAPPSYA